MWIFTLNRRWLLSFLVLLGWAEWAAAAGLPHAKPQEVGFSPERLQRISDTMQRWVEEERYAGITVAVVRRGRLAYFESFGNQDREAGTPMRADSIFRFYSMTKPITSTAAMILLEEGRFLLRDPVSDFIPGMENVRVLSSENSDGLETVALENPMTIRHLLTHTSGLSNSKAYEAENIFDMDSTLEQLAKKLPTVPLANQPGAAWRYAASTDVLGRVIEVASGMTLDTYFEERIFRPLGMKDTAFWVPQKKIDRLATAYQLAEGGGLEVWPQSRFDGRKQPFLTGGGGLYSTADDYLQFCQMLLNGGELDGVRVLSPRTVELMMINHVPEDVLPPNGPNGRKGYGFGLGAAVLMDVARSEQLASEGEFSWGGKAGTYFWIDRKEQLIGLFLVQRPFVHRTGNLVKTLVYQALVD